MSYFSSIVLGLIAGFIGSKIVNRRGEGILLDILWVLSALAGGWLFSIFGGSGVNGLNLYSISWRLRLRGRAFSTHRLSRHSWYRYLARSPTR